MKLPSYQDLSKEQDGINNLPLDGSYLVLGPPGTGKTVMALYRTSMLNGNGTKVSLLMYSRLLSQYTSDATNELDLDGSVSTFHRWLYGFYLSAYHKRYPQVKPYMPEWGAILSRLNTEPPPRGTLSHLIVDEGQDLAPEFYLAAQHCATAITVFADENQRLNTATNSTIAQIKSHAHLTNVRTLTRNYRNTKEIAILAAHFYTGLVSGIPEPPTRSGETPLMLRHGGLRETLDFLIRFEKAHQDLDIGVLVPNKKVQNRILSALTGLTASPAQSFVGGKGAQCAALSFGEPGIKVICYQSAKGLEFDAVFLPELQECTMDISLPEFKMMFYVLISRARDYLFLSSSGAGDPRVLNAFPRDFLEWRS